MEIDRRSFLTTLGGVAAVEAMSSEALADALEHRMMEELDAAALEPRRGMDGGAHSWSDWDRTGVPWRTCGGR